MPRFFLFIVISFVLVQRSNAIPLSESLNSIPTASNSTSADIVVVQGGIGKKAAQSLFAWPSTQISDSTATGRSLLTALNTSTARTVLELITPTGWANTDKLVTIGALDASNAIARLDADTKSNVELAAVGTQTNIGVSIQPKGSGTALMRSGDQSYVLSLASATGITFTLGGNSYVMTNAGAALLDDATAAAQRTTLGVPSTSQTIEIAGTSNEITSSAGPQDLSASRIWTLSLPNIIDLGGKTSFEIPNSAAPAVSVFGQLAADNNLWATGRGAPVFFDGTSTIGLIGTQVTDTPSEGQVAKWHAGGTITWEDDNTAVGGTGDFSSNTATSVNDEFVLFSGTGGKTGKRATGTGLATSTSGVYGTVSTSAGLFGVISDETGTGALTGATSPTFTTSISIGSAGVKLSDDGDGALTFLSLGNGSGGLEDLTINLDDTANVVTFSSSTGVTAANFSGIGLQESGNNVPNATDNLSFFSATTSSQLAGVLSDETGTGAAVFGTSPTFTTQITSPKVVWTGSVQDLAGTGTPEASVTAPVGSVYRRTDGGTSTTLYVKESGTGNTGWVAAGAGGGGGAPSTATYITQTPDGGLSAEQALSSLSTGIMRVATTTGVITSLTNSAEIAANISDETGTGLMVFSTAPTFSTSITTPIVISAAADPADAGAIRLGNAEVIGWEASPASTDVTLTVDSNEVMQASGTFNAVTLKESNNDVPNVSDNLSVFSLTTSAQLAGVISNETGTGALVFGTDPVFLSSINIPNGLAPTTDAAGEIAFDTNAWATGRGALQIYDGTANTYAVGVLASDTPSAGQVPTFNSGGTVTWESITASAGGSDSQVQFNSSGTLAGDSGFTYNAATDTATLANITSTTVSATTLEFEGATADANETTIAVVDPTADRTITLPDRSGTVVLSGDTLTGDVAVTFGTSGTQTATIQANAVALTTDTTGNYVASLATSAPVTGGAGGSEGATLTIGIAADGIGPTQIDETANYAWTGLHTFNAASVTIGNGATGPGVLKLNEDTDNGTNFTSFQTPAALAANVVYTLPPDDGNAGEQLTTDGSGVLTWASAGGSGGGAPTSATYITQTSDGTLSAEQALSSLSTGIMRVATTTGIITSLTDSAGIFSNISDETGTGVLVGSTSPTFTTSISIGSAGVKLSDDGDGALTFLSLGNGSGGLEDLTINLDDTANTVTFSSSTGVTVANFSGIGLQESGNNVPNSTDNLGFFSATTSAQLATVLSDETGTGAAVFANGNIGDATATTPTANDNDTSVATTAYVQTELTAYNSDAVTLSNKTLTAPKFADLGFISDANGNEMLIFDSIGSAVNNFQMSNQVASSPPRLSVVGDDTNIDMEFMIKGTGKYMLRATASGPATLRFYEDSDNGANALDLVGPASITSDYTVTLPSSVTTLVGTDTTDTLTNKTFDASATGNVLKMKSMPQFTSPGRVDGTGCTIGTTQTSVGYGLGTFSNLADETANWMEFRILVPADFDTAVNPTIKILDMLGGADINARRYNCTFASTAASGSSVPTLSSSINVTISGDASGASGDIETSAATSTNWGGSMTPGNMFTLRVARDGNDAADTSTVDSTVIAIEFTYGVTQ